MNVGFPPEVWTFVFSFLKMEDMIIVRQVCKMFHKLLFDFLELRGELRVVLWEANFTHPASDLDVFAVTQFGNKSVKKLWKLAAETDVFKIAQVSETCYSCLFEAPGKYKPIFNYRMVFPIVLGASKSVRVQLWERNDLLRPLCQSSFKVIEHGKTIAKDKEWVPLVVKKKGDWKHLIKC